MKTDYKSFTEFYSDYLAEHQNQMCRRWHFIGSLVALLGLFFFIFTFNFWAILFGIIVGYGCAWVGHFKYEKNKPTTFKKPWYSFLANWVMFKDMLSGKLTY